MRILSLDLATCFGFAIADLNGGMVGHGSEKLPKTGDDVGKFLAAYRRWLGLAIELYAPTEIVFEQPILVGLTNMTTLRKLYGLAGMTELVALDYNVPCFEANLTDIRMFFLGLARAPKDIVGKTERRKWLKAKTVAKCRERGFTVRDDNDADALALMALRLSHHRPGYVLRERVIPARAAA